MKGGPMLKRVGGYVERRKGVEQGREFAGEEHTHRFGGI